MSDWQERITQETAPAIRAEHELRYRLATPLILPDGPWLDLGCGNGLAAAAAFGGERPTQAVLVDIEEAAVARARHELGIPEASALAADLTDQGDLSRVGEAVLSMAGAPIVSCFEVVEHLATFLPLLEWAGDLVREHGATFLISVPNDAFWSIQNPHHMTSWGDGAFEELRRLLPPELTLLRQVALSGSALASWERGIEHHAPPVEVGGPDAVATHFIAVFGPRHGEVRREARVVQTDMLSQRCWERQRENDLALMQKVAAEHNAEVEALDRTILEQGEELRERTVWFEEWRKYIHELEQELGRPLSGASGQELPASGGASGEAKPSPVVGTDGAAESRDGTEPPA
jgi:SAM-dependent methyltransferase